MDPIGSALAFAVIFCLPVLCTLIAIKRTNPKRSNVQMRQKGKGNVQSVTTGQSNTYTAVINGQCYTVKGHNVVVVNNELFVDGKKQVPDKERPQ